MPYHEKEAIGKEKKPFGSFLRGVRNSGKLILPKRGFRAELADLIYLIYLLEKKL